MNIPNILTALRFFLIPVFGFYLYKEQYIMSIVLFTVGAITDILDGYIARKFNMVTSWGKLADPLADKLMQITALVLLTSQGLVPAVFIIIVVAKEAFMGVGSIHLYRKENVVVSASWYGKLATVIFYFAIVMTIIMRVGKMDSPHASIFSDILVGIAVVSTLYAFFMYSLSYRRIRNESK